MIENPEKYIEHTNLKPGITHKDVEKLISEAEHYKFHAICIPPFWVKKAARDLQGSEVKLVTVIGFPFGYNMTQTKERETELAIRDGADEIDLVWSLTAFKAEMIWPKIEIVKIAKVCHESEKILKVIIETPLLNELEIAEASKICVDAGADFVKTATGFNGPAKVSDVEIIKKSIPDHVEIKASAGIKTPEQFEAMIKAGATRIGTSGGVEIINNYQ